MDKTKKTIGVLVLVAISLITGIKFDEVFPLIPSFFM